MIYYFGYAKVEDNPTGFFEYPENEPEMLARFNKFSTDSQECLKTVSDPNYKSDRIYTTNSGEKGECDPMFSDLDLVNIQTPGYSHASRMLREA